MTTAQTRTVLVHALEEISKRGWTVRFSSGPDSSLNLRSAISAACSDLTCNNSEWYQQYLAAIRCVESHLKDGVTSWEFGTHANKPRPRVQSEVEQMLTELIERLEKA